MSFSRQGIRIRTGMSLVVVTGVLALAACSGSTSSTASSDAASAAPASSAPEVSSAAPASSAATDTAAALPEGSVDFREAVPGSGTGLKLGYIGLSDALPFAKLVTESMKEEAKAAGAELVVCDSALDGAKALACAKNFKTQGVQAYLNFQVDAASAAAICEQGPQVPVIAVDIEQKPCQGSFMGANNEAAGYLAGKALGEFFKANKDCKYDAFVSMEQPAAGAVNDARMGGYRKGFEESCGPITNLKKVDGGGAVDSARTKFADVLTSIPDAKTIVVVGINDDSILGSLAAAKTSGRQDSLFMSGQGADPSSWCQIKNNPNWVVDTAYFPEKYGKIGIPYLIDVAKGGTNPKLLLVPHQAVTAANINDFYPDAGNGC